MGFRALFAFLPLTVALTAADAPTPQTADAQRLPFVDPAHWRCFHDVERPQGVVMVTRSLDAGGRFVYDYVGWLPRRRFGASSVGWERLDPGSTALPWRLRTDGVSSMVHLAGPVRRPVWLVLRVDGRIAGRRLLFRQLSDLPDYDRGQPEFSAGFSGHPMEAGRGPDIIPELIDATEAVLSAEEEGGETLWREPIALPGRALIEQAVAEAAPAIAAAVADYRRLCQEEGHPPPMPPMPPPPN